LIKKTENYNKESTIFRKFCCMRYSLATAKPSKLLPLFNSITICSNSIHLRKHPVDEDWLLLTKPIDSEYWLNIMRRIPWCVKYHDSVCRVEVDAKSTGLRWYQEQSQPVNDNMSNYQMTTAVITAQPSAQTSAKNCLLFFYSWLTAGIAKVNKERQKNPTLKKPGIRIPPSNWLFIGPCLTPPRKLSISIEVIFWRNR